MEQIFTFPFTVVTMPNYRTKIRLGQQHGRWPTVNPWIADLEWPNEMAGCNFGLRASLWGSEAPWRADEALAEIAEASGGVAQDPTLEAALPDALTELRRLRVERDVAFMGAIRFRPGPPFRVIFPALSASWNTRADVSVLAGSHARRNSLGRRRAMSVCYEIERRRGHPGVIAAARLFPCTASGDEHPHPTDSFLLQIHR